MSSSAIEQISFESIRQPGKVFELTSFAALHRFEGLIARHVDAYYRPEFWEGRLPLEGQAIDEIQARRVDTIDLEVMAEPYRQLVDANLPTWQASNKRAEGYEEKFIGFAMAMHVRGYNGDLTVVNNRLWYAPLPRNEKGVRPADLLGKGLIRIVETPPATKSRTLGRATTMSPASRRSSARPSRRHPQAM